MSVGLVLAGRYRLTQQLGVGGMGSVWRAEDTNLGAEVAIKLIDAAFASSPEAVARFRREARAAAAIRSTYVVQIFDYGVDDGTPFIAMELLKGESLAQRLERVGKLTPEQTGHVLGHVGRALQLAHDNGIVHRDMKPENVYLVREGNEDVGKVLDFGIARQSGGLADSGGLKTQTGAVLGTPYYMSPEQATAQAIDHRTDIWSFAIIAFECLAGRRAFESESLGGLFHAICMAPMLVPSQVAVVPAGFDAWFARAAARDQAQRFATIAEAAESLRLVCGTMSGRASAVTLAGEAQSVASVAAKTSEASSFLHHTAAPSSQTIGAYPRNRLRRPLLVTAGLLVAACVTAAFGWSALQGGKQAVAPLQVESAHYATAPLEVPSAKQSGPEVVPVNASAARAVSVVPVTPVSSSSTQERTVIKPRSTATKSVVSKPVVADSPKLVPPADPVAPRLRNAAGF